MARSSECTDEYAQNELIEPTLSETLIEPQSGPDWGYSFCLGCVRMQLASSLKHFNDLSRKNPFRVYEAN
jgi:hypothetical protein